MSAYVLYLIQEPYTSTTLSISLLNPVETFD